MSAARLRLALILATLASGCSYSNVREAWVGQPVDTLIHEWGPPSAVTSTAYGRTIAYEHTHTVDGTSYDCKAMVQADPNDRITRINLEGNVGGCNRFMQSKERPGR